VSSLAVFRSRKGLGNAGMPLDRRAFRAQLQLFRESATQLSQPHCSGQTTSQDQVGEDGADMPKGAKGRGKQPESALASKGVSRQTNSSPSMTWRQKGATEISQQAPPNQDQRGMRNGKGAEKLHSEPPARPADSIARLAAAVIDPSVKHPCSGEQLRRAGMALESEGCAESVASSSTCLPTPGDTFVGEEPVLADVALADPATVGTVVELDGVSSRCRTVQRQRLRLHWHGTSRAESTDRSTEAQARTEAASPEVCEDEAPQHAPSEHESHESRESVCDAQASPAGSETSTTAEATTPVATKPLVPPGRFSLVPVVPLPPHGVLGPPWMYPQLHQHPHAHLHSHAHLHPHPHVLPSPPPADQNILQTLVASKEVTDNLIIAAHLATAAFEAQGLSDEHIVLYGSLALVRSEFVSVASEHPMQLSQMLSKNGIREVKTSYITNRSDVDYAIYLPDGRQASAIVGRILALGEADGWKHEQATVVPRFAVSQWTLVSEKGVHLDLTFFSDQGQFERFGERQRCFREVFWQSRHFMHATFGPAGIVAFDAYIYVLKAFAAFVSRTAFTSFQAVCIGLFVLQHSQNQRMALYPSAQWLFNHFLSFCCAFFDPGKPRKGARFPRNTSAALDLSRGRMMRRVGQRSRAELYFVLAEEQSGAAMTEWQNVLHNSDPEAICEAARAALKDWFGPQGSAAQDGSKLSRALAPSMTSPKPR